MSPLPQFFYKDTMALYPPPHLQSAFFPPGLFTLGPLPAVPSALQPAKTFHCQVSPLLGNSTWPPPPVNAITPHVFLVTPWVDQTPSTGDLATPWVDLVTPTGDSDHPLTCSPPTCASICPCTCLFGPCLLDHCVSGTQHRLDTPTGLGGLSKV